MPDFLVFQLYGALASWGDIAVGERRHSLGHPTKSAITGLLAAALGIDRSDDKKHLQLTKQYGTAICVRAPGELLHDYHTSQVPRGKQTYASRRDELMDKQTLEAILSQRDYRTDALYQLALWCRDNQPLYPLDTLRKSLRAPHFTLYLGRKSCPVGLPLFPVVVRDTSLKNAFDTYPLDELLDEAKICIDEIDRGNSVRYYWESGLSAAELGDLQASMVYPRHDQISSRRRWQFANRDESYCEKLTNADSSEARYAATPEECSDVL